MLTLQELAAELAPDLAAVITALAGATREISEVLEGAALTALPAVSSPTHNVHGELQKPLDLVSNDIVVRALQTCPAVAALVSEEMIGLVPTVHATTAAPFIVAFDPLDGSSNLGVNVSVGTIFSVVRRAETGRAPTVSDALQPGRAQVAAGFALYGPATVLVLTVGRGTHGFTLDRQRAEFVLTHPDLQIPPTTMEFAINAANARFWEPAVRRYVEECTAGGSGPRGHDFNTRWVASLVADAYRILTRGGVYLYPRDARLPQRAGRLRALYECHPIAFLIEQAGGLASTGREHVLDRRPTELHERQPLVFGSRSEVERIESYHQGADTDPVPVSPPAVTLPTEASYNAALFNDRSLFRAG